MLAAAVEVNRTVIDLLVILAIAGLIALVMQRMRMALVPAYLLAGMLVGPSALGFVDSQERLEEVSHFAIILLLFGIGLELDTSVLRRGVGRMVLVGVGSCAACVCAGWPLARAFGLSAVAALVVAMAFSLSSTALVLRLITARRELRRRSGRLCLAILVIQDIVVLGMLALLPPLAGLHGSDTAGPVEEGGFLIRTLVRIGGIAALVVVGKLVLPRVLTEALRAQRLEVLMLVGLTAALGAAVTAQMIGFSLEMGAFLAGFLLAGTPFKHQLSGQIGPLRDIFGAIFFTTVGMKVDPAVVLEGWWVIALGVLLVISVKSLVIGALCIALGTLASTAMIVGFYLAQAGEFSLVLLGAAGGLGILGPDLIAHSIAIVVVTLVVTPNLAQLGRRLARGNRWGHAPWIHSSVFEDGRMGDKQSESVHVIIGGFGPIGRRIAEELERLEVSYTIVELNPDTVREQLRRRRSIVFGDIANIHVLESAGLDHADALVLTIPDEEAVLRACAVARRRRTSIFIAARTGLEAKKTIAIETGADHVVVDEMATAAAMLEVVVDRLGRDEPTPVMPEDVSAPTPPPP